MKLIALVSGGIDSPVAAALMKADTILHFCLYPYYCTGSFRLFLQSYRNLKKYMKIKKLIIVPWNRVLKSASRISRKNQCVLCRSTMLKCADMIAEKEKASAIITGEAVGQKASQTLSNIRTTSTGIKTPVIRPLIGMTKEDIIKKSRELGLWMPQHSGCCTIVPNAPATKSNPDETKIYMKKLSSHIEIAMNNKIEIKDKEPVWNGILKKCIYPEVEQ